MTGNFFGVMFAMEGLGFWYGAKLILSSSDNAIQNRPLPIEFRDAELAILRVGEKNYRTTVVVQEPMQFADSMFNYAFT